MLGRADLGQPGIPKVPLRHAGHLSWGCVSQHNWRFPFTLCSEAVGPVAWQCVFGLERVEALLSVWLALWGWSLCLWSPPFRQSPLQTPEVSGSLLSVLSVPAVSGPAKGPLFPYVAGVRCNVVACVPRVTPSSSSSLQGCQPPIRRDHGVTLLLPPSGTEGMLRQAAIQGMACVVLSGVTYVPRVTRSTSSRGVAQWQSIRLHSGRSWVRLPPPSPGRSGTPALCGGVAAPTWSHYQVCQASAKLVPGPQYLGRNARAHSNILVPSAPRCMGLDFLKVMASEEAERAWDYSYSYSCEVAPTRAHRTSAFFFFFFKKKFHWTRGDDLWPAAVFSLIR